MATIDADAHVLEQPKTWSYMRDFEQQFVPMIVTPVDGPAPAVDDHVFGVARLVGET